MDFESTRWTSSRSDSVNLVGSFTRWIALVSPMPLNTQSSYLPCKAQSYVTSKKKKKPSLIFHFNSRECHVSCNSMSLTHHHFPCSPLMFATFHLYRSPHHPYQYHLILSSLFTVIGYHYLTMTTTIYIDCHFLPLFCSYIMALYHSIFPLC